MQTSSTTHTNDHLYDLVIIGAAAVGCAAAVYASRRMLDFVVIAKDIGGEVALSGEVENWPGTIHTTGFQLAQDFHKHALHYNTPIHTGFKVTEMRQEGNVHRLIAVNDDGETREYRTKAIIVGSGIHPRELGIPGEQSLKGKGVTYCTVCDGPLYRKKITATIGAGNAGLESALMMSDLATHVYLLTKYTNTPDTQGGFPRGEKILVDKVKAKENITILYEADTQAIEGGEKVTGVTYVDMPSKEKKTVPVDGVMVHIGMIPNSYFAKNLKQNAVGEIEISLTCETSVKGIFAGGDVSNIPYKQIGIAAGHGIVAALSAIDYINRWTPEHS